MLRVIAAISLALMFLIGTVHADPATGDVATIAQLLHGMFDKPGETLVVEPIVQSGDHAIVGWIQGKMGGRALLRRRQQKWALILCAGDGIKSAEALQTSGVPATDAKALEAKLAVAEAKLSPERVAMFSRFEGLVMMDGKDAKSQ